MRYTPNDPATCWHEDLDTRASEVRDGGGRLIRVEVVVVCDDCERALQTTYHAPGRPA